MPNTTDARTVRTARGNHQPTGPPYRDDQWLSLLQAADVIDVAYDTIAKWAAGGRFCPQAVKLPNRTWRVRYDDLMQWVASLNKS